MTVLAWCFLSLVLHEVGHLIVARAFGVRIKGVVFDRHGIGIRMERGSPLSIFFSALAGPMVNVLLAVVFHDVPAAWLFNFAMAIVNLLPVPFSDGRRVLEAMHAMRAD